MRTRENTIMMVIALFSFLIFCQLLPPFFSCPFLSPSFLPALLSLCVTDPTDKSRAIEPCITVREKEKFMVKGYGFTTVCFLILSSCYQRQYCSVHVCIVIYIYGISYTIHLSPPGIKPCPDR